MIVVDYHDFSAIDTPKPERERLHIGDIWENAAKCHKCGDTIRSRNRHDFNTCKCGDVSVDGGSFYTRRLFKKGAEFTNIIVNYADAQACE